MTGQALSKKSLFQYGFMALPVAFAGFRLYVLAPDFYATHHGINLTVLGIVLLVIRMFDALQDPFFGWFADKLRGRFMSLITAAGSALALSIFGLFNFIIFSPVLWFALCMFFAVSAYSILTIVLGAQATLWTQNKDEQTGIAAAREAFALVGLVMAVSMPNFLSYTLEFHQVYIWYSAILAFLMLIGVIMFSRLVGRLPALGPMPHLQGLSLWSSLKALPGESLKLFAVYGLSMLTSSIPAVLVIFYVRDLLGAEHLTGPFLMLYFIFGLAAIPFWKKASIRIGKYKAWCFSNVIAVLGLFGAFFLDSGDIWLYGGVCIVSGFALGADVTLPPSILSDHIHSKGNRAYSGTHYSFLVFMAKFSLALASAIALPTLDAVGFKPQTLNSQGALLALSAAYALIPCVLKLMAASLLYAFFIRSHTGENNEKIQNNINHRSSDHA